MALHSVIVILFILLLLGSEAFAGVNDPIIGQATNQNYPFRTFGAATVSSDLFSSKANGYKTIETKNEDRDNVFTLEGEAHLNSLYFQGQTGKPFVIIMPGIGGTATDGNLMNLARMFHKWGFFVLTIDDPFSWKFALTLNPNGVPGFFPNDAKILYQHLESVFSTVTKKYKPSYSGVWFVTYSLGSQYAQDLLKIDDEKKTLHFQQVVMLNPLLDIDYSIKKYDGINEPSQAMSDPWWHYQSLRNSLFGLVLELLFVGNSERQGYYYSHFPLNSSQSDALIGGTFKDSLDQVLYVTSMVHPDRDKLFTSELSDEDNEWNQDDRNDEIRKISFNDYFGKFVLPMIPGVKNTDSSDNVIYSFSLKYNLQTIAADKRIKIVLTKDDPLSRPEDNQLFSQTFKDRALLLDVGGHCGMFWFPGFEADFKAFLKIE